VLMADLTEQIAYWRVGQIDICHLPGNQSPVVERARIAALLEEPYRRQRVRRRRTTGKLLCQLEDRTLAALECLRNAVLREAN